MTSPFAPTLTAPALTAPALTAPALTAHALYRFFHVGDEETAALRGVSLAVAAGEMVAIMGPSGSGKSTLLNCLAGLDAPDAGYVSIGADRMTRRPEGERARLRARSLGLLQQSGNLFAHFTVAENIRFQMMLAGKVDASRLTMLIDAVGLSGRADATPAQLSGGETARAGLAVALANDPAVLIADEPTAEVDAATEDLILALFAARKTAGRATVIATHSAALGQRADRILHMADGGLSDG